MKGKKVNTHFAPTSDFFKYQSSIIKNSRNNPQSSLPFNITTIRKENTIHSPYTFHTTAHPPICNRNKEISKLSYKIAVNYNKKRQSKSILEEPNLCIYPQNSQQQNTALTNYTNNQEVSSLTNSNKRYLITPKQNKDKKSKIITTAHHGKSLLNEHTEEIYCSPTLNMDDLKMKNSIRRNGNSVNRNTNPTITYALLKKTFLKDIDAMKMNRESEHPIWYSNKKFELCRNVMEQMCDICLDGNMSILIQMIIKELNDVMHCYKNYWDYNCIRGGNRTFCTPCSSKNTTNRQKEKENNGKETTISSLARIEAIRKKIEESQKALLAKQNSLIIKELGINRPPKIEVTRLNDNTIKSKLDDSSDSIDLDSVYLEDKIKLSKHSVSYSHVPKLNFNFRLTNFGQNYDDISSNIPHCCNNDNNHNQNSNHNNEHSKMITKSKINSNLHQRKPMIVNMQQLMKEQSQKQYLSIAKAHRHINKSV